MTGRLAFRRAERSDLPAVTAVQHAAFAYNRSVIGRTPIPLEWDYDQVFADWEIWLGEDGAADPAPDPAGVLILDWRPGDLYIESLAVAPRCQGAGYGNDLLAFAEARARDGDRRTLRLVTNELLTRNNVWYARKGYVLERTEDLGDRRLNHRVRYL